MNGVFDAYFFDACALIAFLDKEPEGLKVKALIEQAEAGECVIRMSAVNWVEVYYHFIRSAGEETADEIMAAAADLPITLIDTIDPPARRAAACLKARYSMSLADCFLCAAALSFQAVVVTKDRELRAAEQGEGLSVLWIT
ncbi:MAG: type II toxin-antitoxin system VapC family toxin, partial [Treponema sp.]|nr:type II toxin-antitoxin system VapC family toxin [Treponema sp.]